MSRSIRIDLLSAFSASGAKALAYAAISRLLFSGGQTPADLAVFTLIRSTLGLMNYASLGIAPAFIRQFAILLAAPLAFPGKSPPVSEPATPTRPLAASPQSLYASALYPALAIGVLALLLLIGYALDFNPLNNNTPGSLPPLVLQYAPLCAFLVGFGMLARLISDIPGGYLQASHRITLDNTLLALADIAWPPLAWLLLRSCPTPLLAVSLAFCICYCALALSRFLAARAGGIPLLPRPSLLDRSAARHLLAFGALLTLSQLSDFLYAPTDFILITWFLPVSVKAASLTAYSLAVQLDAAMLLLTAAVSTVLYPRAAHAIARHDIPLLRKYYRRGTLLSASLLILAAIVLLLIIRPLLHFWIGADVPLTRQILPLLLIHTVIGGSTAPARAVLFAAGKAKAFALSAVAAGVLNVAVSFLLVRYTSLGLYGIVLGTITAVFLRGLLFLPWYTLRTLRRLQAAHPA